jgi:hypothetical protein
MSKLRKWTAMMKKEKLNKKKVILLIYNEKRIKQEIERSRECYKNNRRERLPNYLIKTILKWVEFNILFVLLL